MNKLFIFCLFSTIQLAAQSDHPQWPTFLQQGDYSIGFQVINTFDSARLYQPEKDFFGNPIQANFPTYRPIQLSVWYPARAKQEMGKMPFQEYVFEAFNNLALADLTAQKKEAAIEQYQRFVPFETPAALTTFLNQTTAVIRNALPQNGDFPILINVEQYPFFHTLMAEYLASHGYVVVMLPVVGTSPAYSGSFYNRPIDLEVMLRDTEWGIHQLQQRGLGNSNRLGFYGYYAAELGVAYQMQKGTVGAIAGIESAYFGLPQKLSGYDLKKLRTPIFSPLLLNLGMT